MGKKATKAADNMYYLARCEAAETNADFSSREKAAELVASTVPDWPGSNWTPLFPIPRKSRPWPRPTIHRS